MDFKVGLLTVIVMLAVTACSSSVRRPDIPMVHFTPTPKTSAPVVVVTPPVAAPVTPPPQVARKPKVTPRKPSTRKPAPTTSTSKKTPTAKPSPGRQSDQVPSTRRRIP